MFGLHYLDIITIGVFFGVIILIGWVANQVMKEGEEGFFLGGRTFLRFRGDRTQSERI